MDPSQVLEILEFWEFLKANYNHIPVIARALIILFAIFMLSYGVYFVSNYKKAFEFSKIAPSVMTAAGLLGTFIGLSMALKDLNPTDPNSLNGLLAGLKAVFVYSFAGVAAAIIFMIVNAIVSIFEQRRKQALREANTQKVRERSQRLDKIADEQKKYQDKSLEYLLDLLTAQKNQQKTLSETISRGLQMGLKPLEETLKKTSY